MSNKIKCILGGGAGLIGSWLSRYLLDIGYDVLIIDNLSESYKENLDNRAKFLQRDISKRMTIERYFTNYKPDYVFSMQAMAAENLSNNIKYRNYHDNLVTTINLLNASVNHNVKKFIHFSSVAIFAGRNDPPYDEQTVPCITDSYAASKYLGEIECYLTKKSFGLDFSIVRAHNTQGKYVNAYSAYRNFIGIICRQAIKGEDLTIFGDGLQTRQFSHVKYLCKPLERLLTIDLPIVHLGADKFYTILEVAQIVQKIAKKDGKDINIVHLDKRHEAEHAGLDHALAKEKLGFIDNTDIEELCQEVYDWVKACPNYEIKKAAYEIQKGLPKSWI